MGERQIDPGQLEGEDLRRWYLRSPEEVEADRREADSRRYQDFFDPATFEPRQARGASPMGPAAVDEDVLWVATGNGGYRAIRSGSDNRELLPQFDPEGERPSYLPEDAAAPEGGQFLEIGNPHNPRLRREWEQREGRPWPRTETGGRYDVSHKRAIADGGTNTLDNIEPMHPVEHKAKHLRDGDAARFGLRPWIARAFGGTVEPPRATAKLRGLGGPFNPLDILGIASGRIRTDSFSNFASDMVGVASPEDVAKQREMERKSFEQFRIPGCPPGMQCT